MTIRRRFAISRYAASVVAAASLLAAVLLTARADAGPETGPAPAPRVLPAVDGVLELFKHKSVVALGDAHGMAQEEDFYGALVRDPRFADQVGNVVVEFGGAAAQNIADRYVAGEDVPFTELRRVWTDVVGWFPGETQILGVVNFFASVRAANLHRRPEQRIKVWLGDPVIDWSRTHSFQDVQPLLRKRDDSLFSIIDEEILKKHEKTLLIVGTGHLFGPRGQGELSTKITQAYPGTLAIVSPFLGYIEPECNAKVIARAQAWPTPAVAMPIDGSWLKTELQLPGCNYIPAAQLERMKKMTAMRPPPGGSMPGGMRPPPGGVQLGGMPPGGPPPGAKLLGSGKPPSPEDMIAGETAILSGVNADAILYLGPPQTLTQSPSEPSAYLDLEYFKEQSRRSQCCTPDGQPLDWQKWLQQGSAVARKYERR